jgi:hypothetical protein
MDPDPTPLLNGRHVLSGKPAFCCLTGDVRQQRPKRSCLKIKVPPGTD